MNNFYLALIFFAVALSSISLKKTYFFLPVTELKRRVKEKDTDSIKLFKVATYDFTFKVIINLIIYLSTAVSILLVGRSTVFATCLLIIFVELYILFSLVPSLKTSKTSVKIASFISPLLALILYYIHPLINRFRFKLKYDSSRTQVNKIYSKADLIKLLSSLNKREHTRLTKKDIELTTNALKFSEKKVSDALISKKQVKTIYDDDVIGPILINEIHESGQNYVLVKNKESKQIVGSLAFKELSIKSVGLVKDTMDQSTDFINEDDSLLNALSRIYDTKHQLLVVVNNFEEFIGIVTIEKILEELIGHFKDYKKVVESEEQKEEKAEEKDKT